MKRCGSCGELKPYKDFYANPNGTYGVNTYCKSCDHKRRQHLYGLDVDTYSQAKYGICLICERPADIAGQSLCVDHDHSTGQFRGLLCRHCNSGLGYFRDSVEALSRAIVYLERTRKGEMFIPESWSESAPPLMDETTERSETWQNLNP